MNSQRRRSSAGFRGGWSSVRAHLGGRSILGDAAQHEDAVGHEPEDQVSRIVPSFCAVRVAREGLGLFRNGCGQSIHASRGAVSKKPPSRNDTGQRKLWGIDLLNVPRSDIPAVTHVDYSARVQTVHEETNPRYYGLLKAFERKTGCGVLVNTSFNVRGEPIVCSPEDAYRCFMRTEMDVLVLENCVLYKAGAEATRRRYATGRRNLNSTNDRV